MHDQLKPPIRKPTPEEVIRLKPRYPEAFPRPQSAFLAFQTPRFSSAEASF